jgi:hypothetical protein
MADYYPLINKAVAGLDKSTGEARRALYERARTALVTQLRGVQPALSESDITRERLALEEAIRKVEAEAARKSRFDAPPERKRVDRGDIPDPFKAAAPKREPEPDAPEDAEERSDESESTLTGTAADLRRPVRPPPPWPRASRPSEGLKEFRNVVADAENLGDAAAQAGRAAREAYNAVPSPSPEFDRLEPRLEPEGLRSRDRRPAPREQRLDPPARETTRMPPPSREPPPREPPAREPPPRDRPAGRDRTPPVRPRDLPPGRESEADFEYPARQERANEYSPRDFGPSPDFDEEARETELDRDAPRQQRTRRRAEAVAAEPEMAAERPVRRWPLGLLAYGVAGLLLLLVVGAVAWKWHDIAGGLSGLTSPFKTAAPTTPPPAPAPPRAQKFNDRVSPSDTASQSQPQSQQAAGADVAQKVVLYEEDPEDPNGKRFVGSAVWRTETVTRGANQPPDVVVRADIDIPERKMAMKWTLQRNMDKTLPASHTIEIVFNLPPDFAHGGVQNVPGVLMKDSEQTRGMPLAGLAVKVTDGYFLIGLSSVDSEMQRNIQLLKEQPWFDVPLVYNDGRRAILAVEKGTPGQRALEAAFAAWKQ